MTMVDKVSQSVIRFLVHPFFKNNPMDFRTGIRDARHILISSAPNQGSTFNSLLIDEFGKVFHQKKFTLIVFEVETHEAIKNRCHSVLINPGNPNLWQIIRAPGIQQLISSSYDLFIDLDFTFRILNAYLCRAIRPRLRMAFSKPYSHFYYNLEYTANPSLPYAEQISNLMTFMKSCSSSSPT